MTEKPAAEGASRNGYQASHQWLLGVLRDAVREAVDAGPAGQDRENSLGWRMGAALGSLLAAHPVDRRGRCRVCRGRGWWGRRRVCMVFQKTYYWMRQSSGQLPVHLAGELGSAVPLPPRRQPEAQRPDPDHGEAGAHLPRPLLASP